MKGLSIGLALAIPAAILVIGNVSDKSVKLEVLSVSDGDTFVVFNSLDNTKTKCRLAFVDAPETKKPGKPGQPYGEEAKVTLARMIEGKRVKVLYGARTYDRRVCTTKLIDNTDVSQEMVALGAAWAYEAYIPAKQREFYHKIEQDARMNQRGLWGLASPEEPWNYRKRLKHKK